MEIAPGPYLNSAVLCEKVLQEQDGVASLIRIVDRLLVSASGPEGAIAAQPVSLVAFINLKSGDARGSHDVVIQQESPSGIRQQEVRLSVLFEGEDRGVNLVMGINFIATEEGLHWFDIGLDETFVTRIPLRVVHQRATLGSGPA